MSRGRNYYVYIMASVRRTLYIGVTSNLEGRVYEHKHGLKRGFTSRYHVGRLVHIEVSSDIRDAIAREKELKGWSRAKKIALIERENPEWRDLSLGWYD